MGRQLEKGRVYYSRRREELCTITKLFVDYGCKHVRMRFFVAENGWRPYETYVQTYAKGDLIEIKNTKILQKMGFLPKSI